MVDETATYAEVSRCILVTLSTGEEGDVLVISFAGHGSPDGYLVLFDTDAANLSSTALPMPMLVELFRTTKARAVLFILDCCVSGQAPVRVLAKTGLARMLTET